MLKVEFKYFYIIIFPTPICPWACRSLYCYIQRKPYYIGRIKTSATLYSHYIRIQPSTKERRPRLASRPSSPLLLFLALAVGLSYILVASQSPLASQGPSEQAFYSGLLRPIVQFIGPYMTEFPAAPTASIAVGRGTTLLGALLFPSLPYTYSRGY